jgi:hypothetical protein
MTIGRGDVDCKIIDQRLSTAHCKITIKGLRVFVSDLNSRNGTYINGDKLDPQVETELKVGSELNIGSYVYLLKDTRAVYDKTLIANFTVGELSLIQRLNFFDVHISWKIVYVLASLLFMSFYFMDTPDDTYPSNLEYLVQEYYSATHLNMIYIVIALYSGCMLHAYLIKEHFHKSYILSGLTYIFLLVFKLLTVVSFFASSDYTYVSSYLRARQLIVKNPHTGLAYRTFKKELSHDYSLNLERLPKNSKPGLIKDFEEMKILSTKPNK